MRKIFYLLLVTLSFTSSITKAQTITSISITPFAYSSSPTSDSACSCMTFSATTSYSSSASPMDVKIYVAGQVQTLGVFMSWPSGGVSMPWTLHLTPGVYTIKAVLLEGGVPIDSVVRILTKDNCSFSNGGIYNDINGNCIHDVNEPGITNPAIIEVSESGIPIDTIYSYQNINYKTNNVAGTIYTYRILQVPLGFTLTCPMSGIIYETVGSLIGTKYFGFMCSSTPGFDLQGNISVRCGPHAAAVRAILRNNFCNAVNADYKLLFSPKYTTSTGSVLSFHFLGLTSTTPWYFQKELETSGPYYAYGDTVNSKHELTPMTGDINPANNIIIRVDTVKAGYDPNDISVYPPRIISAGTELEYTIRFENTGNDTAFNIHILDTLSNNVDLGTLQVVASSHNMNLTQYVESSFGTNKIVKFDFPNINLLDSSHHDEYNGMVIFKVKAKNGLPNGTQIFNRAGIYFDYNAVVMTNTVENIIPYPPALTNNTTSKQVNIYPNPAGDVLNIETGNKPYLTATITNTIGQVLFTYPLENIATQLNVKSLPHGIYFLSLKGESGVQVQKFEKQ